MKCRLFLAFPLFFVRVFIWERVVPLDEQVSKMAKSTLIDLLLGNLEVMAHEIIDEDDLENHGATREELIEAYEAIYRKMRPSFKCSCGKSYNSRQGLKNHEKKCNFAHHN
jgi:hypothetical protein